MHDRSYAMCSNRFLHEPIIAHIAFDKGYVLRHR
jgi:hypothetical protein